MDGAQIAFGCVTIGVGLYTGMRALLNAEQSRRVDKIERHDDENGKLIHDLEMSNVELVQRCNHLTTRVDELERRFDVLEQSSVRKREIERMQGNLKERLTNINRGIWKIAQGKAPFSEPPASVGEWDDT